MVEFEETPFGTRIIGLKEAMLKPFEHEAELNQLRARNAELEQQLSAFSSATPSYVKGLTECIAELEAKLAALLAQVNKTLESYMLDDADEFTSNIFALREQAAIAAAKVKS